MCFVHIHSNTLVIRTPFLRHNVVASPTAEQFCIYFLHYILVDLISLTPKTACKRERNNICASALGKRTYRQHNRRAVQSHPSRIAQHPNNLRHLRHRRHRSVSVLISLIDSPSPDVRRAIHRIAPAAAERVGLQVKTRSIRRRGALQPGSLVKYY